jgi:hypothetical protein
MVVATAPDVRVVAEPGRTDTFEDFCRLYPGPAVAVDGRVSGPSQWSDDGLHLCLNHHQPLRLFTRATCAQARLMAAHGLWDRMRVDGHPRADVHVNDGDPDVCLTVYVLANFERLDDPRLERLVIAEDLIDTTAGAWLPRWVDEVLLAEMAWVFQPYFDARAIVLPTDPAGLLALIGEVNDRISAHVEGRGGRSRVWGDFDVIARRGDVVAVRETGQHARVLMRRAGLTNIVAERTCGGIRHMTLLKSSQCGRPDLFAAYERLNLLERCPPDDRWGGSDIVGGSPRRRGTRLPLVEVLEVVAAC